MWREPFETRQANRVPRTRSSSSSSRRRKDLADPAGTCNGRHPGPDALNPVWRNQDRVLPRIHASWEAPESRSSEVGDRMSRPSPKATRQIEVGHLLRYVSIADILGGAIGAACSLGQLARSGTIRQTRHDPYIHSAVPSTGLGRYDAHLGRSSCGGRRWRQRNRMNTDQ